MEPARNLPVEAHDVNDVHEALEQAAELLRVHDELLARVQEAAEDAGQAPPDPKLQAQNLDEIRALLDPLHPADVAYILEALPREQRLVVWDLVKADRDGEILLEVSDAVRETLIDYMDDHELVAATGQLDTDEIADLAPDLPREVIEDVFKLLPPEEREQLREALAYAEDTAGGLMDFDMVQIREDVTLEVVLRYLRRLDELPDHTDQLFVVDRAEQLKGLMPINRLLVADLDAVVGDMMLKDYTQFNVNDEAGEVAAAFERYDLVSAPVVDDAGKLVGRMTVNAVVDYTREKTDSDKLSAGGLREDEDIFASVWKSVQNRWSWLALNLITAFAASRVIGIFEGSIAKLVALAALMPIIAGIGGNSGNQTTTMIVRALALGQIHAWRQLLAKEIGVAMLNGVLWGGLLGVITYVLYGSVALGGVMALAMLLTLLLAALVGVGMPYMRSRFGKDPAVGTSVLITACTDSGGFFIFLGLATLFLL